MYVGRLVLVRLFRPESDGNGHGRLYSEYVFVLAWASSLAAEVENPYLIAEAAHVLAHSAKGIALKIARRADEAGDARPLCGVVLEDLPQCPAPEVDVEIVDILDVAAVTGIDRGVDEILQNGEFLSSIESGFGGF